MSHGQTDSSNVANWIPSRPANSSRKVLWADSSKESSSFQAQLRSLRSVAPAADTKPWRSPGPMSQMTSMPTLHLHWGKWPELTGFGFNFNLFLFLASEVRQTWPNYLACVVGSGWHRTPRWYKSTKSYGGGLFSMVVRSRGPTWSRFNVISCWLVPSQQHWCNPSPINPTIDAASHGIRSGRTICAYTSCFHSHP